MCRTDIIGQKPCEICPSLQSLVYVIGEDRIMSKQSSLDMGLYYSYITNGPDSGKIIIQKNDILSYSLPV